MELMVGSWASENSGINVENDISNQDRLAMILSNNRKHGSKVSTSLSAYLRLPEPLTQHFSANFRNELLIRKL